MPLICVDPWKIANRYVVASGLGVHVAVRVVEEKLIATFVARLVRESCEGTYLQYGCVLGREIFHFAAR